MNDQTENRTQKSLAEISSELRVIRTLLIALLLGVAVLIVTLLNPGIAIILAVAGSLSWLLLSIGSALINRPKRKSN